MNPSKIYVPQPEPSWRDDPVGVGFLVLAGTAAFLSFMGSIYAANVFAFAMMGVK